jgi:hypothetical protein
LTHTDPPLVSALGFRVEDLLIVESEAEGCADREKALLAHKAEGEARLKDVKVGRMDENE